MEFHHYQPKPGHPDWDNCQKEALELANKIRPLILKDKDLTTSDKRRDFLRKARSLKKTAANLLINRRKYNNGDHAFRPLYVIWTTLNACNFRCGYCDNHQGEHYFDLKDPRRLRTPDAKRLLEVMATGTPAIYWCGGEPTLRADLPELLDYAWDLSYFPNMINTNGSLLHRRLQKPGWEKFLWQMDVIIMSMDALNIDALNKMWGVKTARQVVVNLLMMRELRKDVRFKFSVNTVITPETLNEAKDVLDLACDLGIWFVPVPVNSGHRPSAELLQNPEYRKLAGLILERKKQGHKIIGSPTLLENLLYAKPYQCMTTLKPHVWSDGSVCFPCRASVNVKPVDINLLDYASFDEAYEAGRKQINPNFFHGPAKNQCGGECAWMQNYTTARYMDGVVRPFTSGLIGEMFEFAIQKDKTAHES